MLAHSKVATGRTGSHRHLHTVSSKRRCHHEFRLLAIRIGASTVRGLYIIASLDVSLLILPPSFHVTETKVRDGGYDGQDEYGQADAQEELHEHVGTHCWGGIGACC